MRRRIYRLPPALRYDRAYHRRDFWRAFLAWEHEARRATTEVRDFQPGEDYGDLAAATDDDDDAPPAVKQEPLLPEDYNDAAVPRALAESKAEEDAKWSREAELDDVVWLSALVAEHHASLPSPPPLPPHAPPHAEWQGQMVPPPPQQQAPPVQPAYPAWPQQAPLAYPEYPAWPQHGAWTPPTLVDLTQDEDEE
jgi:hypothetical protein